MPAKNSSPAKKIFISHSSQDKPFVHKLIGALREAGLNDPWFDAFEIDAATQDILQSLLEGIKNSEYFLIVLSPSVASSHWVTFEIQKALELNKPVLAILHNSPDGYIQFLSNPFFNELLSGGRHKVINFTGQFEQGLINILLVLAPDVGRRRQIAQTLTQILEDKDPDIAEQAMSSASLRAEDYLVPLLEKLPDLRDSRFLRYRIERTFCYMGEKAIEALMEYLLLDKMQPKTNIHSPAVPWSTHDDGWSTLTGNAVIDWIRYTILSGGNRAWSAQLGAEYCLVALAKENRSCRARILDRLREELMNNTSLIVSYRDSHTFNDDFYDRLRLTIETLGLIGPDGFDNCAFLVYQYGTSHLWRNQADEAKYKLWSYIVECLSRIGSQEALRYLLDLANDKELTPENVHPNPWRDCFVPFGNLAVDELLAQMARFSPEFRPTVLLNLAQLPNPRAQKAVLDRLVNPDVAADKTLATSLALNVAECGEKDACKELLNLYKAQNLLPSLREDQNFGRYVTRAVALASQHVDDQDLAQEVCGSLRETNDLQTRFWLFKAIEERRLYRLYDILFDGLKNGTNGVIRGGAAISLARLELVKNGDEFSERLAYAEKDTEVPYLSVALSYLNDPRAIPGLVHGLQYSFREYREMEYKIYAEALKRITTPEAEQAYAKWVNRI